MFMNSHSAIFNCVGVSGAALCSLAGINYSLFFYSTFLNVSKVEIYNKTISNIE
jgi:hypothetical protein